MREVERKGKENGHRGKKRWWGEVRQRGVSENLVISLQKEKASRDAIISAKDDQLKAKDREIEAKESEISEKDRGLVSLQQRCGSLQTQLETVQRRNQSLEVSGFSC